MSNLEQKGNEIPEWDVFNRIEGLEKLASELREKTEAAKPTLEYTQTMAQDAYLLAMLNFMGHFANSAIARPNRARALKDSWMKTLKNFAIDNSTIDVLENAMLKICDIVE
jgi:hypothetical protein